MISDLRMVIQWWLVSGSTEYKMHLFFIDPWVMYGWSSMI